MAWNPKGGPWGSGGGGPWGGSGPSAPPPPNIEDMLRRSQERFGRMLPGKFGGWRGLALLIAVVLAIWLATGLYRVQPGEEGVELLFGRYVETKKPGLNYWFPAPIGEVLTPNVERTNNINIGFRTGGELGRGSAGRDVISESLMLTSDENIIDVDFIVQWRIKNAPDYLFNMQHPDETIKVVAESAIREVMGQNTLDDALTSRRQEIEEHTKELMQSILDSYKSGVLIVEVKQQKVDPPSEVIDSFNDVQRARQDQERLANEANAYRNDIIPRAKGDAQRIIQQANAYKDKAVLDAQGEAQRFKSIYDAYTTGKDITIRRLYLERMQDLLSKTDKIIIDPGATDSGDGGTGVVPYLPLPEIKRHKQEAAR